MRHTVKINGQLNGRGLATSCDMQKASLTAPLLRGKTKILLGLSHPPSTAQAGLDKMKANK